MSIRAVGMGLALLLLIPTGAFAVQYYVRPGGSPYCDGRVDVDGTSGACAWADPNMALNDPNFVCSRGDDLIIHAGDYGPVATAAPCRASDPNNKVVVETDPDELYLGNRARIIGLPGELDAVVIAGGGSASTRTRYMVFRGLEILAASCSGLHLAQESEDIELVSNVFTDTSLMTGPTLSGCSLDAHRPALLMLNNSDRARVEYNQFVGTPDYTQLGITGGRAASMYANGADMWVRGNYSTTLLGAFVSEGGDRLIVEDNVVTNQLCLGDDGCVQIYDDDDVIVRHNVFWDICVEDNLAAVKFRATSGTTNNTAIYNNTFKLAPTCLANRRNWAIEMNNGVGPATIINNLILGNGSTGWGKTANCGTPGCGAVTFDGCPATGSATFSHTLYWDNRLRFDNLAGCACSAPGCDANAVLADPGLDPATYAPEFPTSPACDAGGIYTARDGKQADSWVGALRGNCTAYGGGGHPPRYNE